MDIPELGPLTPQKSNVITRAIGRLLLFVFRWQVTGKVHNAPKFVMVWAPHTSYWDFFIAHASRLAVGFQSSWLFAARNAMGPVRVILQRWGGIPIDRSNSHNVVSQIVEAFNANDSLLLAISPEGAQSKVEKWKTGFWHIAAQAGVPVQLVSFDYKKRVTECGPVIELSDDIEADMKRIQKYYKGVNAKHPEKFGGEYL
jgi:1-acyl-sn-glycerol-3-phosphate acyltransferase